MKNPVRRFDLDPQPGEGGPEVPKAWRCDGCGHVELVLAAEVPETFTTMESFAQTLPCRCAP